MKAYPEYKDSGHGWASHIPETWKMMQLKFLTENHDGKRVPVKADDRGDMQGEYPYYGANGIIDYVNDYLFDGEYLLVGEDGAPFFLPQDVAFVATGKFWVNNHAHILKAINGGDVRFLKYSLNTVDYREYITGSTRDKLTQSDLSRIKLPIPTLPEQQAIADFLDRKTSQIDTLIEKKQRELELLREMRDVLAQNAMRSSKAKSIKLGEVAEWIKRPINRQDEELYERIGLYNRGRGIFHKPITKGVDLGDSDFFEIKDGDFVLSGQFAWEGAVALAQKEEDGCIASHRYYSLKGKPGRSETAYLFSFFTTQLGDNLLNHHSRGAAGRNRPLNINTLLREKIPVPPLSMQKPITDLIEKEVVLKKNTQKLVEFLREYRTALISEAVTGKVDVRTVHE